MRASVVSPAAFVTRISSEPSPLIVPAKRCRPVFLSTGTDSPGDRSLVDSGFAGDDFAVERNAHGRFHGDGFTGLHFADGHFDKTSVAIDGRHLRRDFEQCLDGAARPTVRPAFEPFRHAKEKHDRRRFDEFSDDGSADGRDNDKQVDVRPQLQDRAPGLR
jgi:hypothetical protein